MSDSGDGLGEAIRRAAEESPRYVSSGLPLSPNVVGLLKRFPRLQDLLRLWGTMSEGEQSESVITLILMFLNADMPIPVAARCASEFVSVATINARGEAELVAREVAERRRQIRVVPLKETQP